jgi:DNA-binding transcriptional MerR regulator
MRDKPGSKADLQLTEPQPGLVYSLDAVVHLTGVSRRSILVYCKSGLVRSVGDQQQGEFSFDDEAIYRIRRVEQLRTVHGLNLAGIRMIFELMSEIRRLENEMRFLRS